MSDPYEVFLASVERGAPPGEASGLLLAVWHGLRGDWEAAHKIAQEDPSEDGAWVHGWLHRIEGDLSNAAYWYRRAAKPRPSDSVQLEGERIARSLLAG